MTEETWVHLVKKDAREAKVTKVRLDLLVSSEMLELLDLLEAMGLLANVVLRDQWARREKKDSAVTVVNKVNVVCRVFPELLVPRERSEMLVPLVVPVTREIKVNPVPRDQKGRPDSLVLPDNPVKPVLKEKMEKAVNPVPLEALVFPDPREKSDREVKMALSDLKETLDQWVHQVLMDQKVTVVCRERLETLVFLVSLAYLVSTDRRENLVKMAVPVPLVIPVPRVVMDHKVLMVDVVLPDLPDKPEKKVKRVLKVKLAILVLKVWVDSLVQMDRKVNLVSMEFVVFQVPLVSLDAQVSPVTLVNPVLLDLSVLRVLKVNPAPREKKVMLVSSVCPVNLDLPEKKVNVVLSDLTVPKVKRETMVLVVMTVLKVLRVTQDKLDLLVNRETRVHRVWLDAKVPLVLPVPLVRPDLLVIPFPLYHHRIPKLATESVVKLIPFSTWIMITILVLMDWTTTPADLSLEKSLPRLRV